MDHFADLYALQAALRYAPAGPVAPLPLYAPSGVFELMQRALTEHGAHELAEAFEVHELVAGDPCASVSLTVTPHPVDHVGTTFALVVDEGDARLCYTSDTRAGRRGRCRGQRVRRCCSRMRRSLPRTPAGRRT